MTRRWLFADMLGPHFLESRDQPVLLVESKNVFRRRRFHRQKAHYVLSALRHLAAELGDRADFRQVDTYGEALRGYDALEVPEPTSRAAERFVRGLDNVTVVRNEGFATHRDDFRSWAGEKKHLLLETFYREQRLRHDLLLEGRDPVGGTWNLDHDNREPPPKTETLGVRAPYHPREDDIDAQVREDLDRWAGEGIEFGGSDGPRRFAATRDEALRALKSFVEHRLPGFGAHEDAMLQGDWAMAHSLLSAPLNLGLLHPLEVVHAAEDAYRRGDAPLNSVEGFVRQVIGWREYVWGVYWWAGADYPTRAELGARTRLPQWFAELDADAVEAACLGDVLRGVRDRAWVHHIPRLMVLGNYALQRGWSAHALMEWFHLNFIDGYEWVMAANTVGMSQHADGGLMATKPYASGGAYLDRMSDYCGGCRYDPKKRLGENACPFTAGYWSFLDRVQPLIGGNRRMAQPFAGLARLKDRGDVVEQEAKRGNAAP